MKMRIIFLLTALGHLSNHGDCFGLLSTNPSAMLSAGKMMTRVIMSNMAKKRTAGGDAGCVQTVGRGAEDFFVGASRALGLLQLMEETRRRSGDPTLTSPAVPLNQFCARAEVERLRAAAGRLVSRLRCLGPQAQDEAGRLLRALVAAVGFVCEDGGQPAQQLMDDIKQCRRLDPEQEAALAEIKSLHRWRRAAEEPVPPMETTEAPPPPTTAEPGYGSLQACVDDVRRLLPERLRLARPQQPGELLLLLPSLAPRLLEAGGLAQFCPPLLKAADCVHYATQQCAAHTQRRLARFFQTVVRDTLCERTPDDQQLQSLLVYSHVKQHYFDL